MSWQNIPLIGFAPDLPNTTPGVFVQTLYTMPTDHGFGHVPSFNEQGDTVLSNQSLGGALVTKTDGTERVFVGINTKLYETTNPPGTTTDRSDTNYTASTTQTWSFCQFGDYTLAANAGNILRSISTGSAFAAVGIAPTPMASIICTCGPVSAPIVMAFDYDDGSGRLRDGWFASGLSNPLNVTGWTTGTNQCVNGRLLDDLPGGITAGIGYRDDVVAFKKSGMYIGTYTGDATNPWAWRRLSGDIGCIGKNALTKANDRLYWASDSAIWEFDGSYPRKIPGNIHNFWAATCVGSKLATPANANFFHTVWDRQKHWLHVFSGTTGTSTTGLGAGLTWNSISGLWTAHGGVGVLPQPFQNPAGTTYAVELIGPKLYVTNNKKIGSYTYDVGSGDPIGALIDGWLIADYSNAFTIRGIRPHWRIYSGTSVDFGGSGFTDVNATLPPTGILRTYASSYMYSDVLNNVLSSTAMTQRRYGVLEGTKSDIFSSFRFGIPAGVAWEMDGISVDAQANGKT